jgi:hypothetical protein
MRNAIFNVIPKSFFSPILAKIKAVAIGQETGESLMSRVNKVFSRFNAMGADNERILSVLGKRAKTELTEEDLAQLIGLGTAIKSQETTIDQAFPLTKKEESADKAKEVSSQLKPKAKAGAKKN